VRESIDEPRVELGGPGVLEGGEGFAGKGFEEVVFVVLEVDDYPGGGGAESKGGALVGNGELAHALAGRPRVDEIGGLPVGKESRQGEEFGVRRRDEKRGGNVRDGFLVLGDRDDAGLAGGAERVRETTDVVQAIGGKVAVVDEEDIHAVRDSE
jgi:hypothetical protein